MGVFLAGCAHAPPPETPARSLPPAPSFMQPAPVPQLDPNCHFPWFKVKGCKGKDTRAMLRLTVSDDEDHRGRLDNSRGWYEGVREEYGAK